MEPSNRFGGSRLLGVIIPILTEANPGSEKNIGVREKVPNINKSEICHSNIKLESIEGTSRNLQANGEL